jgi:formylglycine-generating enzyme required for sulfatase activity
MKRALVLLLLGGAAFAAAFATVSISRHWRALPQDKPPAGMVWIPGGEFSMGTDSELGCRMRSRLILFGSPAFGWTRPR